MASRNRSADAGRDAGRPDDVRADRRHAGLESQRRTGFQSRSQRPPLRAAQAGAGSIEGQRRPICAHNGLKSDIAPCPKSAPEAEITIDLTPLSLSCHLSPAGGCCRIATTMEGSMSKAGLDNRHRNHDGEISNKHGNTLIRTLRKIYGQGFAEHAGPHASPFPRSRPRAGWLP